MFPQYEKYITYLETVKRPKSADILTLLRSWPKDQAFLPLLYRLTLYLLHVYGYTLSSYHGLLVLEGCTTPYLHRFREVNEMLLPTLQKHHLYRLANVVSKLTDPSFAFSEEAYPPLIPLIHVQNSCYLDVVLMCLCLFPNEFLHTTLFYSKCAPENIPLQLALRDLTLALRYTQPRSLTCQEVRNLLPAQFRAGDMQDASEVLFYLFNTFQVHGTQYFRVTGHNDTVTSSSKEKSSPVVDVPIFSLEGKTKIDLQDCLYHEEETTVSGWVHPTRKEVRKILYSEYLVFYVNRKLMDRRNYTAVVPPKKLHGLKPDVLLLSAIIVHKHNHYTAYILRHKTWFYYDDMKVELKPIGDYSELLSIPEVATHGLLYFYT